ncbi:hypothetical protein CK203_063398 [Vitis vinifera]|uniref:Uncharacterized protein n=1 Tax=Vitis vinifera TaxID=29760 RepID=A0A438G8Y7_VITVI|nr:hypothetical protein CK203_063398 [Vitis vinifera]
MPRGHPIEEATSTSRPISAMARIRGGHTDPSIIREARPRASSPQDSSQALTILSSKGEVPSSPPQCQYSTQRPPTSPPLEPSHPSGIAPEAIIKRPMVTQPPIEGNTDCRTRSFHFELYFDIEDMRQQSELQDSFGLLQRTWSTSYLGGLLEIHSFYRQGAILDALFRISEGFYFGPHHLIMVVLLHFEEKVHRRKLQRADIIPLLLSRLLCHILEHIGYPTKPHLKRHHHCQEHFTLDKWT